MMLGRKHEQDLLPWRGDPRASEGRDLPSLHLWPPDPSSGMGQVPDCSPLHFEGLFNHVLLRLTAQQRQGSEQLGGFSGHHSLASVAPLDHEQKLSVSCGAAFKCPRSFSMSPKQAAGPQAAPRQSCSRMPGVDHHPRAPGCCHPWVPADPQSAAVPCVTRLGGAGTPTETPGRAGSQSRGGHPELRISPREGRHAWAAPAALSSI